MTYFEWECCDLEVGYTVPVFTANHYSISWRGWFLQFKRSKTKYHIKSNNITVTADPVLYCKVKSLIYVWQDKSLTMGSTLAVYCT